MPAFQPYRGKPAVRNDREGRGNVGIMRSPVRASTLPDCGGRDENRVPTATQASGVRHAARRYGSCVATWSTCAAGCIRVATVAAPGLRLDRSFNPARTTIINRGRIAL